MNFLIQDIRIGLRTLLKSPGFTGIVILTLALGIGANTAIFSFLNALLFRPLAVENPDQVVVLTNSDKHMEFPHGLSYVDFMDYRDQNDVLSGIAIYTPMPVSVAGEGRTVRTWGMTVSGGYFPLLGVEAIHGRTFAYDDEIITGGERVVVLGYTFWQRNFDGDVSIIGKTMDVNGTAFTVTGIMPEGFCGTETIFDLDLYLPLSTIAQLRDLGDIFTNREAHSLRAIGRLKEGVTAEQAQAEMRLIGSLMADEYPDTNVGVTLNVIPEKHSRPEPSTYRLASMVSIVLMALVSLVLFIACANVANLLLARGMSRSQEIAVRVALGAGRFRIIRQLLTETLMLALLGSALGLLISGWATSYVASVANNLPVDIPINFNFEADIRVYLFALLAAVACCLFAGLMPAWQISRVNLQHAMKEGRSVSAGTGRHLIRKVLVVAQLAISLLLLICSGLFMKSLINAQNLDMGFNADNLLLMSIDPGTHGYDEETSQRIYNDITRRVASIPGVEFASMASYIPFSGMGLAVANIFVVGSDELQEKDAPSVFYNSVDQNYFEAMGVPILRGRGITELDTADSMSIVVINQAMADQRWPGQDPLGKQFHFETLDGELMTVVGITATGKYGYITESPRPFMYRPLSQNLGFMGNLHVRTSLDPMSLAPAVRGAIQEVDSTLPIFDVKDMHTHLSTGNALMPIRMGAMAVGCFGMLGLVLAAIGIYGVIAYSVSGRTHEFGVRMALGASGGEVLKLVFREGMILTAIGVVVGLVIAFATTKLISGMLLGVNPYDLTLYGMITALLVVIALAACYFPARKATKIDPTVALRYE